MSINQQYSNTYFLSSNTQNITNPDKNNPFSCIDSNDIKALELFLSESIETSGLLHYSIANDRLSVFDFLLKQDIDLNEKNEKGETPLIFSVRKKKSSFVQMLLDKEIDISYADDEGKTALFYAVENEDSECVSMLLEKHSPTSSVDFYKCPLYVAIQKKNIDLVYLLLHYGTCPIAFDENSFLEEAIKVDSLEIFKILLALGADPQKINTEALAPEYQEVYNAFAALPVGENSYCNDLQKNISSISDEIEVITTNLKSIIAKSKTHNFNESQITPAINFQNTGIYTFSKFVKKLDTTGKQLFQKRIYLICSQLSYFAANERNAIKDFFDADESAWNNLIDNSQKDLLTNVKSIDTETNSQIGKLLTDFDENNKNIFRESKEIDPIKLKEERAQLAFQNIQLVKFYKAVDKAINIFISFKPNVFETLTKAIDTINGFQEKMDVIMKSMNNIAIDKNYVEEESSCNAKQLTEMQSERMQVDSAYLGWLYDQFGELSILIERCLRMCMQ